MNAVPHLNGICRITPDSSFTCYPVSLSGGDELYGTITSGPDNSLWFTEQPSNKIGRITTAGAITEYRIPTKNASPWVITLGPDKNMWFTEANANQIGRAISQKHSQG
jgi:virginiamycin B lyase